MFQIIALLVGVLILAGGLYYLMQSKDDAEGKKIYTVIMVVGAVITVVSVINLLG